MSILPHQNPFPNPLSFPNNIPAVLNGTSRANAQMAVANSKRLEEENTALKNCIAVSRSEQHAPQQVRPNVPDKAWQLMITRMENVEAALASASSAINDINNKVAVTSKQVVSFGDSISTVAKGLEQHARNQQIKNDAFSAAVAAAQSMDSTVKQTRDHLNAVVLQLNKITAAMNNAMKEAPIQPVPQPAPQPTPVEVVPEPAPVEVVPEPTPVEVVPTPVEVVPTPVEVVPEPAPVEVVPEPNPNHTVDVVLSDTGSISDEEDAKFTKYRDRSSSMDSTTTASSSTSEEDPGPTKHRRVQPPLPRMRTRMSSTYQTRSRTINRTGRIQRTSKVWF